MKKQKQVGCNANYLNVNVILTFDTCDQFGETQDIFDLALPIGKDEVSAAAFLDREFFKLLVQECIYRGRSVGDLIKISTASNWTNFEKVTNLKSTCSLGHSGKWFFSREWKELDQWEERLIKTYGFGANV